MRNTAVTLRGTILLGLILFLFVTIVSVTAAHAKLVRSDPRDGKTIANAPQKIVAVFDEELAERGNVLTVTDQSNRQMDTDDSQLDLSDIDRRTVTVTPRDIEPGSYTVRWKVVSADDRAITEGQFRFRLAGPGESVDEVSYLIPGLAGVGFAVAVLVGILVWRRRTAARMRE